MRLPLFFGGFISIPACLIAKTCGKVSGLEIYSFEGSSSMKATIDFLVNKYNEQAKNSIFANVQPVGSRLGLEKLLEGSADFALVSQDVTEFAKEHQGKWEAKKLRTITLGKEAMVLLYKPPRNCSDNLDITKNNVNYIYSAFSGHKHNEVKDLNWSNLISNCKGEITTWVKSSGPSRSGTANAFVKNPMLQEGKANNEAWLKKVNEGYGDEFKNIKYTSESNLLSWNSFVGDLSEGSLIYLPSSFVFGNIDEIKNRDVKIAKLGGKEITSDNFKEMVTKGTDYQWGRTYNLVYSTLNLNENKKNFVKWILENLKVVESMHLIPIGAEQQQQDASHADKPNIYGIPFLVSQKLGSQ